MGGVLSISSVSLVPATAACTAVPGATTTGFAIDTANNAAYGVATAAGAYAMAIMFDGSLAYDATAYTTVISTSTDANGYAANPGVFSGVTHAFSRNGSSFVTNSFGPLNKMTVTDLSGTLGGAGADGAITISAFDAAGLAVTCTGLVVANLPNNGTTTIQGADITTACPGAKRINGTVNSTAIQSTNTKITADGATSQSGTNGSTAISN